MGFYKVIIKRGEGRGTGKERGEREGGGRVGKEGEFCMSFLCDMDFWTISAPDENCKHEKNNTKLKDK